MIALTNMIDQVRTFMRDRAEINRLLSGVETQDRTISLCLDQAIDLWNGFPPFGVATISVTISGGLSYTDEYGATARAMKLITYPANAKALLLQGTILEILKSVVLGRSRNSLAYSDGGVTVQDEELPLQNYLRYIQLTEGQYTQRLQYFKQATNVEQLFDTQGGIGSDYSYYYIYEDNTIYM